MVKDYRKRKEPVPIDPAHERPRRVLRTVGPILAVIGLIMIVIGIGNFFASLGGFEPPRYFWCAFVGMPLLFVGLAMTKIGYMGRIARYMAEEIAPVGKDTINYMAEGTQGGIRSVARAIGEGLRDGSAGGASAGQLRCHKCNTLNDADAKFCDTCGAVLAKDKTCSRCGEKNDPDARFCDNCGNPL